MNVSPARALALVRGGGPGAIWWRLLEHTAYRRMAFLARPVEPTAPRHADPDPELSFSLLEPGDVDAYSRLRPDVPVSETRRRLAAGEHCQVGYHRGELVHARWFAFERVAIPYLGHSFALAPGVVYIYDGFTAAAFRRMQVGTGAPSFEATFGSDAARALLAAVWPENRAGAGLAHRLGYESVGTLAAIRTPRGWRVSDRRLAPGYLGAATRFAPPSASVSAAA